MNSQLLYLVVFGLIMAFCCYPMVRMMMQGSDASDHPESTNPEKMQAENNQTGSERASGETTGVQHDSKK